MRFFTVLSIATLMVVGAAQAQNLPETRKITVQGEGVILTSPDMAMITVGVSRSAKKAAAALSANSSDMSAVFKVLVAAGIAPRDMQTSGLSLHPRRERRSSNDLPPKIVGYEAVNTVHIRVRDIDSLGAVLDQLARAGANQIHSISFGIQEPRPLMDQARQAAVLDARSKAELYAKAAGVSLGDVLRIDEVGGGQQQPQFARMGAMAAEAMPIARGETGINVNVQIVYLLE